ncbi:MAG: permease [Gemmatimonadetes bacterium]|nr:permease [Gemmatimonadota bacterium]
MLRPGIRRLFGLDLPRTDRIAAELHDEMELHLELRTQQLIARGLSPAAARAQARRLFGDSSDAIRDIAQHARRRERTIKRRFTLDSLAQDVRFALRTLGRQKAWTAVAIVTLALGIGANTAVFSVVNDLILDPLRYPHADRLILLSRAIPASGVTVSPSVELLDAWRGARSLEGIEGYANNDLTLAAGGDPRIVHATSASRTFPAFSGAHLVTGRWFNADEERAGAAPVAVLGERLWRAQFNGDASVLGRSITIEGKPTTVIGVMQDGVRMPSWGSDPTDLWVPFTPAVKFLGGPAVARLRAGMSVTQAQQELASIATRLDGPANPARHSMVFTIAVARPGIGAETRQSVFMLAGAVCLLLLIACANVAHLLLARGATRERELAVRAALGAGRGRIMRQLVTESMMLALAGCVAGLLVGVASLRVIVAMRPPNMSTLANVHIDARVLLATMCVSLLTGLAFGLVAALQGKGDRTFSILRSSVGGSEGAGHHRLRSLLVVTESAMSVVLLVGATLLIRTVINLRDIDPGFDARNVYAMPVTLPEGRYPSEASRVQYGSQLLEQAKRIPGVSQATIASSVPTKSGLMIAEWMADGEQLPAAAKGNGFTAMNRVRPDYFALMRMPLVAGRGFDAGSSQRNEVVISRSLAKQLFRNAQAVGRGFRARDAGPSPSGPPKWMIVSGVVEDASLFSLSDLRNSAVVYFPEEPTKSSDFTLVLKMRDGAPPLTAALRKVSLALDPAMSPPAVLKLTEELMGTIAQQRFIMTLLTLFAVLAVVLSAVGLYGVIAYMVSRSTREIGIRVALGAARRDVARLVTRQGLMLSGIGLAIGLLASLWGTALLKKDLYGVTATDPLSYVVGAMVLLVLAAAACVAPTVRALRIDPMTAMRSE